MIANNLKALRGKHGLSQKELANKIGVSTQRVSQAENGKLCPGLAIKIADALGENVFSVLGLSSFVVAPKTFEDKEILLNLLNK